MKKTFYIILALCISAIHAIFLDAWLSSSNTEKEQLTLENTHLKDSLVVERIFPAVEREHINMAKSINN